MAITVGRRQPLAVSHSLIPADANDGVVVDVPRWVVPEARRGPALLLASRPALRRPVLLHLIPLAVNEQAELGDCDRILADAIGVINPAGVSRFLIFISQRVFAWTIPLLATHDELAGRYLDGDGDGRQNVFAGVAEAAEGEAGQAAELVGRGQVRVGQEGLETGRDDLARFLVVAAEFQEGCPRQFGRRQRHVAVALDRQGKGNQTIEQSQRPVGATQAYVAHRQQHCLPPPGVGHAPALGQLTDDVVRFANRIAQIGRGQKLLKRQMSEAVFAVSLVEKTAALAHRFGEVGQPLVGLALAAHPDDQWAHPGDDLFFPRGRQGFVGRPRAHHLERQLGQDIALLVEFAAPLDQRRLLFRWRFVMFAQQSLDALLIEFGALSRQRIQVVMNDSDDGHQQGGVDQAWLIAVGTQFLELYDLAPQAHLLSRRLVRLIGGVAPLAGQYRDLLRRHGPDDRQTIGEDRLALIGARPAGDDEAADTVVVSKRLYLVAHDAALIVPGDLIQTIQQDEAAAALHQQSFEEVIGQADSAVLLDDSMANVIDERAPAFASITVVARQ